MPEVDRVVELWANSLKALVLNGCDEISRFPYRCVTPSLIIEVLFCSVHVIFWESTYRKHR